MYKYTCKVKTWTCQESKQINNWKTVGWVGGKVKQWWSNKKQLPALTKHNVTWPKPISQPQRCVRKTFSPYFVLLSQWEITLTLWCIFSFLFFSGKSFLSWIPKSHERSGAPFKALYSSPVCDGWGNLEHAICCQAQDYPYTHFY